jgi:hypothetical protein
MSRKYRQGIYKPINYQKYDGDPTNIIYRSSWERKLFNWLDRSSACTSWSSEETIVHYVSPVDGRPHRYFVDVKATFTSTSGLKKTYLIEVKPFAETMPPKSTKNKKALFEATATFAVNQSKWQAAREYCKDRGWEFKIVTEYELGIKQRQT